MDANAVIQTLLSTAIVTAGIVWLAKTVFQQLLARDIENHKNQLQTTQAVALQQMRAEHEKELEQLKNKMEILSIEHETRFTKLHEKRLEVLLKLYKLLDELEEIYSRFTKINEMLGEGWKLMADAYSLSNPISALRRLLPLMFKSLLIGARLLSLMRFLRSGSAGEFWRYFDENRLYLDESLCNKILEFDEHLSKRSRLFREYTSAWRAEAEGIMSQKPMFFPFPYNFLARQTANKTPREVMQNIEETSRMIADTKRSIEEEFRVLMGVHSR